MSSSVGVRWTIGDVNDYGFEALRLSVWGARRIFGPEARYAIYVNTVSLAEAHVKTGPLPPEVEWRGVSPEVVQQLDPALAAALDRGMAEGVAWKFLPLVAFPDRHEIALDNDCILWAEPDPIVRFRQATDRSLIAADVRPCFGRFAEVAGPEPRNSGIRGLPPHFDLAAAFQAVLTAHPGPLTSELDEQGLQVVALARAGAVEVVSTADVSICSPFPPHLPELGRCGAHFVGLNTRRLGWTFEGLPAEEVVRRHWQRHRLALYERVGIRPIA